MKSIFTIAISFLLFNFTFAQKKYTVNGTILDQLTSEKIIGASIKEKNTKSNFTLSNIQGKFSLEVSSPNAVILISYIG
jgi:hypothetical protein